MTHFHGERMGKERKKERKKLTGYAVSKCRKFFDKQ
jgi:hypothetical protein